MSYGIMIKNSLGEILIDGKRKMPFQYEIINDTLAPGRSSAGTFAGYDNVDFTATENLPIVLSHLENGKVLNIATLNKDSSGLYNGFKYTVPHGQSEGSPVEFHIYTTGEWPPPPINAEGLQLFNSDGECIFHSHQKTLEVLTVGESTIQLSESQIEVAVDFPPTTKKPLIWVGNPGVWNGVYNGNNTLVMYPWWGDLQKNNNNEWYRFYIKNWPAYISPYNVSGGWGSWTFPWVVFV